MRGKKKKKKQDELKHPIMRIFEGSLISECVLLSVNDSGDVWVAKDSPSPNHHLIHYLTDSSITSLSTACNPTS